MLVFEQVRVEANGIWERIKLDAEAWFEASKVDIEEEGNVSLSLTALIPWQKPCDTFVKCNIGTSWIDGSQNCGVSWLVRDHLGKALTHSRRSYSAVPSGLEAELLGFAWAVESMVTMRYDRVVFESSSYLAGEAILHPELFLQYQPLIDQIRNQLSCLRLWSIAFVHKEIAVQRKLQPVLHGISGTPHILHEVDLSGSLLGYKKKLTKTVSERYGKTVP
ncbi:LOW QUALITY PROTEIN: hypothetical protein Bca101_043096 [Brassica carinata]